MEPQCERKTEFDPPFVGSVILRCSWDIGRLALERAANSVLVKASFGWKSWNLFIRPVRIVVRLDMNISRIFEPHIQPITTIA